MCIICVCVHSGEMMYSTRNTNRTQEYFACNFVKHVVKAGCREGRQLGL